MKSLQEQLDTVLREKENYAEKDEKLNESIQAMHFMQMESTVSSLGEVDIHLKDQQIKELAIKVSCIMTSP